MLGCVVSGVCVCDFVFVLLCLFVCFFVCFLLRWNRVKILEEALSADDGWLNTVEYVVWMVRANFC